MPAEMSLLKGIKTLRSVRKFKRDPVTDEDIRSILKAAANAASGSNTQPWQFVVVRDPKIKARLTEPMLTTWLQRLESGPRMSDRMKAVYDDATEMLRNTANVPAIIFCCLDLDRSSKSEEVRYGSIFPAVQNLMLAAHALGLGSCLTAHGSTSTRGEPEVKKILGIPDHIKVACLVYLGYPLFKLGPPKRKPIEQFIHHDGW